MKETLRIVLVLTFVCGTCAFLLTFIYSAAQPQIERNAVEKVERALINLAPDAQHIEEIVTEGETIYKLADKDNSLIGYGFIAQGQGYQGTITMMAVIDPQLTTLKGIEVVSSMETPGLGSKIKESPFRSQFEHLSVTDDIVCIKTAATSPGQIMAITGATVSSKAVTNILNARIKTLRQQLHGESP